MLEPMRLPGMLPNQPTVDPSKSVKSSQRCSLCFDTGVLMAFLRDRAVQPYTFRCYCDRGMNCTRTGFPKWDESRHGRWFIPMGENGVTGVEAKK